MNNRVVGRVAVDMDIHGYRLSMDISMCGYQTSSGGLAPPAHRPMAGGPLLPATSGAPLSLVIE